MSARFERWGAWLLLAAAASWPAMVVPAQVPSSAGSLSEAERTVLAAYRVTLDAPAMAEATRAEVVRQVGKNPPLAYVDGYWVTPVDVVTGLLGDASVREALGRTGGDDETLARAEGLLQRESELRRLTGLAFTAHQLRARMRVPHVNDLEVTSPGPGREAAVFLVLLRDVEDAIVEYLPPPPVTAGVQDDGCRFFCGDPETWDFDGDGVPNRGDEDDDGDGVADAEDAYPYFPGAHSCRCDGRRFTGFTEKFSAAITRAVLKARARLDDPERVVAVPATATATATATGSATASGFAGDLRVVFP